jgi:hypothetical protein
VLPPLQIPLDSLAAVKGKNQSPDDPDTGLEDVNEPPPPYTPMMMRLSMMTLDQLGKSLAGWAATLLLYPGGRA